MIPSLANPQKWSTLKEACKQLHVSPTTLRQWADQGRIESFRTPGGHRRFRIPHDSSVIEPAKHILQMETLIHSAIGKTRLEIAAGRLNQEHWHSALDEKNKEEYRKLGQQLMSTLLTLLREPSANVDIDSQARDLGKLYARLSLRQGNRIADILHAYFFFRDYVFEGLFQLSSVSQGTSANDMLETYRQLGRFTNTMLISIVESFSEASRPT